MDFFIITGPQAVGKMTVGEELAFQRGYKLFHNHMTIDLLMKLFTYEQARPLIVEFRKRIFEEFLNSEEKGLIFTFLWAYELQSDWDYINWLRELYKEHNVYIVELYADIDTRLSRNVTENRLEKKWTKRDIEGSNYRLKETLKKHRVTSLDNEVTFDNYIKIDNTFLSPKEVVDKIKKEFILI